MDPTLRRQYVTRFPVPLAIKFIGSCIEHGSLPSDRLKDIMEEYFEQQGQGAVLMFDDYRRRIVDAIARKTGQSREEVVLDLIYDFGQQKLAQVVAAEKVLGSASAG